AAGQARGAEGAAGQVVGERALHDGEAGAAGVEDRAAPAVAGGVDRLVVGQGGAEDLQGAGVFDGRPLGGPAVGGGPGAQGGAGVFAADGQPVGAGAGDGQAARGVGDAQLAGSQADRAAQVRGEGDVVGPEVGVGVEDRLPQRAVPAVVEVGHQEDAGQGA